MRVNGKWDNVLPSVSLPQLLVWMNALVDKVNIANLNMEEESQPKAFMGKKRRESSLQYLHVGCQDPRQTVWLLYQVWFVKLNKDPLLMNGMWGVPKRQ